ncbi:uncharacterized protein BO66DRAFT_20278 [Aspergillus aculeatinus CBS 121060]|uniref:Uncharacterized protein n=1 Tax=Aspergillus aculeatinus CBS 121060 TaxID=1448322 RepID=A0ACD1HG03_9EURO|nr:hypothetical protein BO66DRAFT_20278 [Aspergillus aculeatinus CBS 121060]RAH72773.1 hypothetical protein BO66DRAFT_20278 [Aspergillus aculeatinus CBS 121060]
MDRSVLLTNDSATSFSALCSLPSFSPIDLSQLFDCSVSVDASFFRASRPNLLIRTCCSARSHDQNAVTNLIGSSSNHGKSTQTWSIRRARIARTSFVPQLFSSSRITRYCAPGLELRFNLGGPSTYYTLAFTHTIRVFPRRNVKRTTSAGIIDPFTRISSRPPYGVLLAVAACKLVMSKFT